MDWQAVVVAVPELPVAYPRLQGQVQAQGQTMGLQWQAQAQTMRLQGQVQVQTMRLQLD